MNKQKFVELLRSPEQISSSDLEELEILTNENPYFQSGHIVVARGSRLLRTPSAGKKINTAAIYATNRAILKHYMQGNVVLEKREQLKSKPAVAKSESKKIAETPKAKTEVPVTPRKAPQSLSKSDHDLLIDDIYANLEKWKKSRDHYLEFEKTSDELELSTNDEDLDDAVEKIKNQIAEEVIAEDNEVSEQIEKIEASQPVNEVQEKELSEEVTVSDSEVNAPSEIDSKTPDTSKSESKKEGKVSELEVKDETATKKSTKPTAKKIQVKVSKKKINLSDDLSISDDEANKSKLESTTNELTKSDKNLDSLNKEQKSSKLKPKDSKTGKKFRLSILNRPTSKKVIKTKNTTSEKKEKAKKETESTPTKAKSSTKKATAVKKTVKGSTKKKTTSISKGKYKKKIVSNKPDEKGEKKKLEIKVNNKADQSDIIDTFLKVNPSIKIDKEALSEELLDLSEVNSDFPKEAITENLAIILVNQDKMELAIEVYQRLILKFPEKKAYFASQIQKLNKK